MSAVPAGISLLGVSHSYRRGGEIVLALDDVSLDLAPGCMTGLVGPSGSGKTTLINLVMGEEPPQRGTVIGATSTTNWNDMAVVPQQLGLLDELSLRENVILSIRLGAVAGHDPDQLMSRLGLDELGERFPHETSLGQQQRAAIARALVAAPAVIVVDEPTSHQDGVNVMIVADALVSEVERGALVLVATHDDRLVSRCDRVVHLDGGRLR